MTALVLDCQPLNLLINPTADPATSKEVQAILEVARRKGWDLVVPAAVLAELYRGRHAAEVKSWLSRNKAWRIEPTDEELACVVGGLLHAAGRGSEDHVDACVVATAMRAGQAKIVTGDPGDILALVGANPALTVASV